MLSNDAEHWTVFTGDRNNMSVAKGKADLDLLLDDADCTKSLLKLENTEEQRPRKSRRITVVRDKAYFANATRKYRQKQQLEKEELEKRIIEFENDQDNLRSKIEHLRATLDFWTNPGRANLATPHSSLEQENSILKEEVERQRKLIASMKKFYFELSMSSSKVERTIIIGDKTKASFSTIMSLCYASSNSNAWRKLNRRQITSGQFTGATFDFKFIPAQKEMLYRMDINDIPIPVDAILKVIDLQSDIPFHERFLEVLKEEFPNNPKMSAKFRYLYHQKDSALSVVHCNIEKEQKNVVSFHGKYEEILDEQTLNGGPLHKKQRVYVRAASMFNRSSDQDAFEDLHGGIDVGMIIRPTVDNRTSLTMIRQGGELDCDELELMKSLGHDHFSYDAFGETMAHITSIITEKAMSFLLKTRHIESLYLTDLKSES